VLETLRTNELLVKGAKSELFRTEVEVLGFKISAKGWAPTVSKIATVVEWLVPETVKHMRSFLGMANFFRSFIPLFSEMAAPLTDLLKNSTSKKALTWSVECQESFVHIKHSLTSAPVLSRLFRSGSQDGRAHSCQSKCSWSGPPVMEERRG